MDICNTSCRETYPERHFNPSWIAIQECGFYLTYAETSHIPEAVILKNNIKMETTFAASYRESSGYWLSDAGSWQAWLILVLSQDDMWCFDLLSNHRLCLSLTSIVWIICVTTSIFLELLWNPSIIRKFITIRALIFDSTHLKIMHRFCLSK